MKYETNVPAPVVEVVEPSSLDVGQLGVGESLIYYVILTNKGLINANGTSYNIPELGGDCKLEPLVEYTNLTLLPQQSYTIPVKVTRLSREGSSHTISGGGSGSGNTSSTEWLWDYTPNTTAPVVEVNEPEDVNTGNLKVGERTTYEVVLVNKGSVPVKDVSYTIPLISGDYKWKPTGESTGLTLGPNESVTITVEVTHLDHDEAARIGSSPSSTQKSSSATNGRCKIYTVTDYYWECGPDKKWGWYPHEIKLIPPIDCPPLGDRGLWTVYGHGLGSPGGDDGGSYSSHDNYNGVSFTAECDPCVVAVTRAVAECLLGYTSIGCFVGLSSIGVNTLMDQDTDWQTWALTTLGCFITQKTLGIIINTAACGWSFTHLSCGGSSSSRARAAADDDAGLPTWIREYKERIQPMDGYINDYIGFFNELFGSDVWVKKATVEELVTLLEAVTSQSGNGQLNASALISKKPQDITTAEFNAFIERINNTQAFKSTGKVSDNMMHADVLKQYVNSMIAVDQKVADDTQGKYQSMPDLFIQETDQLVDRLQNESTSTCATISLQIEQTMTMTRQAFRGTLTVTNGNKEQPITNAKLKLNVTNRQTGLTATAKEFEMPTESLKGFEGDLGMESGWYLGADSTGTATILFIPSKYAAPDEPVDYSFGGTLSYVDPNSGLEVTRELYPVTLTVKPSPELDLTYFMQRDLYGDDALTEEVEPMVPGEFAVLINNKGNGDATNVRMVTKQPKIIENEKGLYIDFEFVSSQLNGQEKTLAMGETIPTDFGTISAHSQAYAQWWLQSSLLGHFVDYDIKATHVTSYGNENLSLLDQVTIHELIHGFTPAAGVVNGGPAVARGFLVNDISDFNDMPDRIYFTDATQQEVELATDAVLRKQSNTEYTLTITPSKAGWNYGSVLDPTGRRQLVKVVRQRDGAELPVDNIWKTDRTLIDGKDWLYERRLHYVADVPESAFLDGEVLLLTFENRSDVELEVSSITGMEHPDYPVRMEDVNQVNVRFNKAVKPETFTAQDVTLTVQGEKQDLGSVQFATTDNTNWTLDFTALNQQLPNGYYVLTVQTATITDFEGYNGYTGKKADWVLFRGGLVQYVTSTWPELAGTVLREVIDAPAGARMPSAYRSSGNGKELYGSIIRLTAVPKPGYEFVNWTIGDEVVSTNNVYQTKVTAETSIVANFTSKKCRLTTETEGFGTISGNATGVYPSGTELQIVANPDEGYQLKHWIVDGKIVTTPDNTLTLTIEQAMTVTAVFERSVGPSAPEYYFIVWMNETVKHSYALSEKPKVTMDNGVFTLTTTQTTVTYNATDVLKFTLGDKDGGIVDVDDIAVKAGPGVDRQADRLIFTGCKPNSVIGIYSLDGRLADQQRADGDGRAEVSLSGLKAGVYVVKSDSITFKIAKR